MTNTDTAPAQVLNDVHLLNMVRWDAQEHGRSLHSERWTTDRFAQDRLEEDYYPTGKRRRTPTAA